MQIHHRFLNVTLRSADFVSEAFYANAGRTMFGAALLAIGLSACGKAETKISTADRVKKVEERQNTDPNFYLQNKAGEPPNATPAPVAPTTVQAEPPKNSAKM